MIDMNKIDAIINKIDWSIRKTKMEIEKGVYMAEDI